MTDSIRQTGAAKNPAFDCAWSSGRRCLELKMCRNIRTLFNFDPPATDEEIRAASVQFVRKLSGFTKPSQANEAAFDQAIDEVAASRAAVDRLAGDLGGAARSRGVGGASQSPRRRAVCALIAFLSDIRGSWSMSADDGIELRRRAARR